VYFMLVPLRKGTVITNLYIGVTTGGTGTSLSKCGIYSVGGSLLASSADQGTAWNTAGALTVALTTPYTVTADAGHYVALVAKTATTMPTLLRAEPSGGGQAMNAIGSGAQAIGTQSGQTDLPTTATIGATSAIGFWMGWS
jgi:hypothetical protein